MIKQALLHLVAHRVPDVVRDDVHRHRLEFVLHVAHREDDELLFEVDVGRLVHESRPRAARVFRETLDQGLASLHAGEHLFKVGEQRRLGAGEVGIAGNIFERIGLADGAVDDGVLFGRKAAEHDAEEADERDDVGAQNILRILVLFYRREVERIDVMFGGERDMERAAAGRLRELFVFALGVDDDDIRAEHERAQDLKLRRIALAGAGLREDDGIVVLERKTIEENERRIVAIDAVQNPPVTREVKRDEREDRRKRRRVQF